MSIPQEHINELKALYPGASQQEEGGITYFFLPNVQLPGGADPSVVDLLLCPVHKDGYDCRLYFSVKPSFSCRTHPQPLNWNANGVHILSRNWFAYSWQTKPGLRPVQMVAMLLKVLR